MKLLIAAAIIIGLIIAGVNTGQDLISKAEKQVAEREGQSRSARTFTEDEFYWDKYNNTHKDLIVKGANKVHRENSRCHTLDPGSAGVRGGPISSDSIAAELSYSCLVCVMLPVSHIPGRVPEYVKDYKLRLASVH